MNEGGPDSGSGSGSGSISDSDSDSDSDFGSSSDPGPDPNSASNGPSLEDRRDESDREWGQIPIDADRDSRDDPDEPTDADTADDELLGPEPNSAPIEPGDPRLENVLFVVLGAIAMGLVLFRLVSLGVAG